MHQMMEEQVKKRKMECGPLCIYLGLPFDGPGKNYSPADAKKDDFKI